MARPLQRITVTPAQIQGQQLQLTADQVHYLRRVLRLSATDQFIAQDGQGQQWQAELLPQSDGATLLLPLAAGPQSYPVTLAMALPKQGFDDVVRQVTELGVTTIQPLISDRTLLLPSEKKLARWQRIAQEAAEQCERTQIPNIETPNQYVDWVTRESTGKLTPQAYICVARHQGNPFLSCLERDTTTLSQRSIIIAIGPEGGWTPAEISVARAQHYTPVSLGSAILRATTAAVAATSIISMKLHILP
ncbi:MAG: 16S rRNA (uracil(1498)-N(3))-methyltransferase [Cyanobacteria bacterium J06632_22]